MLGLGGGGRAQAGGDGGLPPLPPSRARAPTRAPTLICPGLCPAPTPALTPTPNPNQVATAEARARAIAQEAEAAALGAMTEAAEATRVARQASRSLEEAKASPDLR